MGLRHESMFNKTNYLHTYLHPTLYQVAFDKLTVDNADQKLRFEGLMADVALDAADHKVSYANWLTK